MMFNTNSIRTRAESTSSPPGGGGCPSNQFAVFWQNTGRSLFSQPWDLPRPIHLQAHGINSAGQKFSRCVRFHPAPLLSFGSLKFICGDHWASLLSSPLGGDRCASLCGGEIPVGPHRINSRIFLHFSSTSVGESPPQAPNPPPFCGPVGPLPCGGPPFQWPSPSSCSPTARAFFKTTNPPSSVGGGQFQQLPVSQPVAFFLAPGPLIQPLLISMSLHESTKARWGQPAPFFQPAALFGGRRLGPPPSPAGGSFGLALPTAPTSHSRPSMPPWRIPVHGIRPTAA